MPSKRLQELMEGIDVDCDLGSTPKSKPPWLDEALFERGQAFYKANAVGILASNFRNLVIGLSIPNLW